MGGSDTLLQVITKPTEKLVDIDAEEAITLVVELNQAKQIVQNVKRREELATGKELWNEKPELKLLPPHLKYSFLEGNEKKHVILSSSLTAEEEEERVISVLKANQAAIEWKLSNLKGISPAYCMHRIVFIWKKISNLWHNHKDD